MTAILRYRTAIVRPGYSVPIRYLLSDNLLHAGIKLFDFGCGHGGDLTKLQRQGINCSGWDPVFRAKAEKKSADTVNLGFVINVIESPEERTATLAEAWGLATRLLVVSAQIRMPGRGSKTVDFSDGVLTSRDTFQKYYTQTELREYIEQTLGERAFPAAPGVFYVFRCPDLRDSYLASRYRRQAAAPRQRLSERRFEEHKELLQPLVDAIAQRGRLPIPTELPSHHEIESEFGSLKRAFALIRRVTGTEEWETLRQERAEDLLVYLALAKFERRSRFSDLPEGQQRDVKEFFGSYSKVCQQADDLLFSAGNTDRIDEACKSSQIGKLLPRALYVHRTALQQLSPILRVYEGCANAWIGEIEGANVIKLHRYSGEVSYLSYPDFDSDPHPALNRTVKVQLRTLSLSCYDYSKSSNPPVLHRKETIVSDDYDGRPKFARLTAQEERHGLLEDSATIGTRNGWEKRLKETGFALRGHRLVRTKSHRCASGEETQADFKL